MSPGVMSIYAVSLFHPPPSPSSSSPSSRGRERYVNEEFDLDLTYITERIIAMSFPATGMQSAYRNSLKDVAKMLKTKHQESYMVRHTYTHTHCSDLAEHRVVWETCTSCYGHWNSILHVFGQGTLFMVIAVLTRGSGVAEVAQQIRSGAPHRNFIVWVSLRSLSWLLAWVTVVVMAVCKWDSRSTGSGTGCHSNLTACTYFKAGVSVEQLGASKYGLIEIAECDISSNFNIKAFLSAEEGPWTVECILWY